ncbi:hypothetical protein BC834DRAFT_330125 [Gloeopeniophorella convolvens]|nr:hypothetical protein BC834DRAFT_330125 [Gloeopeniophorella convolvens]
MVKSNPQQDPIQRAQTATWDPNRFVLSVGSRPQRGVVQRGRQDDPKEDDNPPPPPEKDFGSIATVSLVRTRPQPQSPPRVRRPSLRRTKPISTADLPARERSNSLGDALAYGPSVPTNDRLGEDTPPKVSSERGLTSRIPPASSSHLHTHSLGVSSSSRTTRGAISPTSHPPRVRGPKLRSNGSAVRGNRPMAEDSADAEGEDGDTTEDVYDGDDGRNQEPDGNVEDDDDHDAQWVEENQTKLKPQKRARASSATGSSSHRRPPIGPHHRDAVHTTHHHRTGPPRKANAPRPSVPPYPSYPAPHHGIPAEFKHPFELPYEPPLAQPPVPRPASFTTSRSRPRLGPSEGPHRVTWPDKDAYPSGYPGPPTRSPHRHFPPISGSGLRSPSEWDDSSERGSSELRSVYSLSQQSSLSLARSILLEQQVVRREEEAARREEEAQRKEEDAQSLEMAARNAFAFVQSLEANAGRIHDAAMQAKAAARRREAEIMEKEAEVLRMQAETAMREVEVARREIAADRAEQAARRRESEARRKEAEVLLKEEDVRRKQEEALRMEEDVLQKKMEILQREEKLRKREKSKRTGDVVASAWEKLKERLTRDSPQVDRPDNLSRSFHSLESGDVVPGDIRDHPGISASVSALPTLLSGVNISTRVHSPQGAQRTPNAGSWGVIPTTGGADRDDYDYHDDLHSVNSFVNTECATSAEASAEYTVKSVVSTKERLHRSTAGHFRRTHNQVYLEPK